MTRRAHAASPPLYATISARSGSPNWPSRSRPARTSARSGPNGECPRCSGTSAAPTLSSTRRQSALAASPRTYPPTTARASPPSSIPRWRPACGPWSPPPPTRWQADESDDVQPQVERSATRSAQSEGRSRRCRRSGDAELTGPFPHCGVGLLGVDTGEYHEVAGDGSQCDDRGDSIHVGGCVGGGEPPGDLERSVGRHLAGGAIAWLA